ncbi:hypothetical protein [Mycolicibacterium confluentis]|uniref:hypothetical protein n=1 Tax=Mycolicibacterium confluentis TaxID=28047 RepID=UPI0013D25267|nr:hypothetical protein [Mycolicibacterium confluentis]
MTFANGTVAQYRGDTDRYRILPGGALQLDLLIDSMGVRRYYSPSGWLELVDNLPRPLPLDG